MSESKIQNTKGFSLVELLIMITLLAILGVAALGSYINSTKTFAFISGFKSLDSSLRTIRSYANTNRAVNSKDGMETPPRFGVLIEKQKITPFADNGLTPLTFDAPDGGVAEDTVLTDRVFDFTDAGYDIRALDKDGNDVGLDMMVFYNSGDGEVSVFETDSNGNFSLLQKSEHPYISFVFTNSDDSLVRYLLLFQISGLLEEFRELPN